MFVFDIKSLICVLSDCVFCAGNVNHADSRKQV